MNPLVKRGVILTLFFSSIVLLGYQHYPDKSVTGRFAKLDAEGEVMSVWHGPWACVHDKKTGLVWENKTDDESIHDSLWTYSWFEQGQGVENSGDCYFEKDRCDTADLIRRANQQGTCGRKDWRLPTTEELLSLVNPSPKTGKAVIHNDFFAHTKRGDYWSADHSIPLKGVYAHLGSGALAVDFIEGQPRSIPYRNAAFVRLVSGTGVAELSCFE